MALGLTGAIAVLELGCRYDFAFRCLKISSTMWRQMKNRDKLRLALETSFSVKTIDRWASGERVSDATASALSKSAKAIGINVEPRGEQCKKLER